MKQMNSHQNCSLLLKRISLLEKRALINLVPIAPKTVVEGNAVFYLHDEA